MATKTFKIGLSNTDKQNMAQDVYERVLALTFNEYDTTTEYEVGDFVVYNDQLYKCISATSGAWDSSKWQLATLNDLVDDIENAVAFVNDKANVDGNYPTMTVGAADNLTPYDEDSGVDQEQPFLLQGTGCGNGEQQVDTGALGLLKEKQGNTVVVNQQITNNLTFQSRKGTTGTDTETDGVRTLTFGGSPTTGQDFQFFFKTGISFKPGHKYLYALSFKSSKNYDGRLQALTTSAATVSISVIPNQWQFAAFVFQADSESIEVGFYQFSRDWEEGDTLQFKNYRNLIDLTQWFGSNDNIPAHLLAHPEDFFRYYQGSLAYNEGTLVNANGRYLKAVGRNQWDEEWEEGGIQSGDGSTFTASAVRSKNYIKVIPNETYYVKCLYGTADGLYIKCYDVNKQAINSTWDFSNIHNNTITIPSNAIYIKFMTLSTYGTTYNHDITISIYYDDESGYDQYYPYEELANIDTGTETLRSAGSICDSKAPDGTITRRIGVVDLGECSFSAGGDTHTFMLRLDDMNNSYGRYNFVCAKFENVGETTYALYTDKGNLKVAKESGGHRLYFSYEDASTPADFKTAMSGVYLFYELAEPTTEQGTTFSENVTIDDFGSMDFGGTNGVPQGASIFYAVDYKAFIDSLYNTLDGDATDIVKDSELDSKLATLGYVKLTSVSGYDATKTQVLKNVEGTLTWVTEE